MYNILNILYPGKKKSMDMYLLGNGGLLELILEGWVEGNNYRGGSSLEEMRQIIRDRGCSIRRIEKTTSNRE